MAENYSGGPVKFTVKRPWGSMLYFLISPEGLILSAIFGGLAGVATWVDKIPGF
jgi:hypothetical protein